MRLRTRLVPVAALVVAIGASAAGAATAAETGSGTKAGGSGEDRKPVNCKVLPPGGGIVKKGPGLGTMSAPAGTDAAIAAAKAQGALKAQDKAKAEGAAKEEIVVKDGGKPPVTECRKPVTAVSLDTIASELGVSKAALTQALTETKQWMAASTTKLSVGQFEQHLADLLHVPVAKVASVFGSELRIGGNPDA
jgi:hypothetical protein